MKFDVPSLPPFCVMLKSFSSEKVKKKNVDILKGRKNLNQVTGASLLCTVQSQVFLSTIQVNKYRYNFVEPLMKKKDKQAHDQPKRTLKNKMKKRNKIDQKFH